MRKLIEYIITQIITICRMWKFTTMFLKQCLVSWMFPLKWNLYHMWKTENIIRLLHTIRALINVYIHQKPAQHRVYETKIRQFLRAVWKFIGNYTQTFLHCMQTEISESRPNSVLKGYHWLFPRLLSILLHVILFNAKKTLCTARSTSFPYSPLQWKTRFSHQIILQNQANCDLWFRSIL